MTGGLGGIWLMVRRSLRQHAMSTAITCVSISLATGLTISVFSITRQTRDAFTGGPVGFDAVLGARGSQLQLVLNTIFHLDASPGLIPWTMYEEIRRDPRVELAIPYCVGDNYRGFRIVGTTEEVFTRFEYQAGRRFAVQAARSDAAGPSPTTAPSRGPRFFDARRAEAVIGSFVAQQSGLKFGDTFNPYHGTVFSEGEKHAEKYVVVGVLEPTNSPSDRVIWIPIEGVFRMSGHVLRGTGREFAAEAGREIADEHKEVNAVMIKLRSPQLGMQLEQQINKQGKVATLAWPIGKSMAELFDRIGWVTKVLTLVAYLVIVVAAASITASVYNTINERRREFAILRSLGARRRTVFSAVVLESATIATIGSLAGLAVYVGIFAAAAGIIRRQTGVVLALGPYDAALVLVPAGMIAIGALAGLLPAWKAYATDVATNLAPLS
ncbi:MAG: hypothetical protein CHACPFDD_00027 [Phycisphaerae bacterium]|nr:hypothetical protein [Phycisphaerae bacterium]